MSILLIFNFDGTSNEPSDAEQSINVHGVKEDDNITNILKFHLLCGGNLKSTSGQASGWKDSAQKCFYYNGVGTYGSKLRRTINALISPEKSDIADILNQAKADFTQHFKKGDEVLLTGFSRGGALARRFCSIISEELPELKVYQAIFDTVASIGVPNLVKKDRPKTDVIFEHGHTLAPTVKKALHMVSLDDKRKAFQPTLMNVDERILEVWFAGAHSDVGGGYYRDGLSDITFRFMLNWLDDLPIKLTLKTVDDIDFTTLLPAKVKYNISIDDVLITPNAFGKNHQQDRMPVIDWFTLTDRFCCVIANDKIIKDLPIVNHSVAQRINGDGNYRPEALKGMPHKIIYPNGEMISAEGIKDHILFAKRNLKTIEIGQSMVISIFASELNNHTALMLEKGKSYKFTVEKTADDEHQQWFDAGIASDADGWDRSDVSLGLKEISIAAMAPFKRFPDAKWFSLIGSIGTENEDAFLIGSELAYFTASKSSEFCAYANDLVRYYGNNSGKLILTVQCISP
ncbi:MAG: hypothetical protein ACI9YH_003661 [Colwellia sp.]